MASVIHEVCLACQARMQGIRGIAKCPRCLLRGMSAVFVMSATSPVFCNGPWFVNPHSGLRGFFSPGSCLCPGSARNRHLMGFEENRSANRPNAWSVPSGADYGLTLSIVPTSGPRFGGWCLGRPKARRSCSFFKDPIPLFDRDLPSRRTPSTSDRGKAVAAQRNDVEAR